MLQLSKAIQTRFKLIPDRMPNRTTVAGIRDTTLGRIRADGNPVGGNVIRFSNPSPGKSKSNFSRICIDPKGVSNKANPHIPVSQGTVNAAANIQKGDWKVLLVVSIVASGIRIAKSIYDEVDIDSEIEGLEHMIDCLEEDLRRCSPKEMADKKEARDFAKILLEDAHDCKRHPGKKTILTGMCIGGEWIGGAALGYAGAQGGAMVGAVGGPVGAVAGAVTGGVLGAVAGSELGASAVENFRCDDDGIATELQSSLIDFGEKNRGEVLPIGGNFFLGKGVEVGARAALFEMKNEESNKSLSYGKVGASAGVSNKGLDVSVEGKVMWVEKETVNGRMGVGLNVDTGALGFLHAMTASALNFLFSTTPGKSDDFLLPYFYYKERLAFSLLGVNEASVRSLKFATTKRENKQDFKAIYGYKEIKLKPNVHCIDVLGNKQQTGDTNTEWRRLGERIAQYIDVHQQSAVLVSTMKLEHFLVNEQRDNPDYGNSTGFEHEGRRYTVTSLASTQIDQILPDVFESEEFVFGLNAWLCLFEGPETSAQMLCRKEDTPFVLETKRVISNLNVLTEIKLSLEWLMAGSDGCELLWYNVRV
ncbi:unnamed protein product, partial [Mesorhabditis belari]|uniref:Uncharacterized protein n=1 Tax=Mesorhabditis belari TaxID=2138241 RepID=A0AAF3ED18_9BILA